MRRNQPSVNVVMLVFGFARSAQFSVTAGSASDFSVGEIEILHRRAGEITALTQAVCHVVSSAFRLSRGEVLMLGIPVAEPEQASGRRGLCVVFTVFVSRRRVASPAMLVQMLASLELAIAQACHGSYTNPSVTATVYTQLLQRRNDDSALDSASKVTQELSLLFTSILSAQSRWRSRIFTSFRRPMDPKGVTVNNSPSAPYYVAALQAARRRRVSRKVQICYYLPFTPQMAGQLRGAATNAHLFLDSGIIVGHSLSREAVSYLKEPGS